MISFKPSAKALCWAACLCLAATCSAQVHSGLDSNEWPGFGAPVVGEAEIQLLALARPGRLA